MGPAWLFISFYLSAPCLAIFIWYIFSSSTFTRRTPWANGGKPSGPRQREIMTKTRVARWLANFFDIWPFTKMKMYPMVQIKNKILSTSAFLLWYCIPERNTPSPRPLQCRRSSVGLLEYDGITNSILPMYASQFYNTKGSFGWDTVCCEPS